MAKRITDEWGAIVVVNLNYSPSLGFLQEVVSPHICGFEVTTIKISVSPSSVHRVTFGYNGVRGVPKVVVKYIAPAWPGDPHGADRERYFYARLLPRLGFTWGHVYHVGIEPATQCRVIVMEDLAGKYRFPPSTRPWTHDEIRCLLRTYARLHVFGREGLPPPNERWWMMARHETRLAPEGLLGMVDDLVTRGVWSPLPKIGRLIDRTLAGVHHLADYPVTLLHNDVYPPNVGLPHDLDDEAVLIDWEMAGWGLAELDLAYLFMQPFRATRHIDRAEALDYYWTQREVLEGRHLPTDERWAIQQHADAVLALWEVPVAHRMAAQPFPVGSAPRAYWDAMFGVLHERLQELCEL